MTGLCTFYPNQASNLTASFNFGTLCGKDRSYWSYFVMLPISQKLYLFACPTVLPNLTHAFPYHFDIFLHFGCLLSQNFQLILRFILSSWFTARKLGFAGKLNRRMCLRALWSLGVIWWPSRIIIGETMTVKRYCCVVSDIGFLLIFAELEKLIGDVLLVVVGKVSNVLLILISPMVIFSISLRKTTCIWYLNYFSHFGLVLSESVIAISLAKTKEVIIYVLIWNLVNVLD